RSRRPAVHRGRLRPSVSDVDRTEHRQPAGHGVRAGQVDWHSMETTLSQPQVTNRIEIETKDGICPAHVYKPAGTGPWPGVLVFMDGLGIRPAMLEVGERLAGNGYVVLLPDLYYRSGPYEPMDARTVFTDPEQRKVLMEKFVSRATPANIMSDTAAFLGYLASQPDARRG